MKERILIFGDGQIGNFYLNHFKGQEVVANISKADITKIDQIKRAVSRFKPTVVVNTAAKTNLEWCEENKEETFKVNVLGPEYIAKVCDEKGVYFIHFSSGCIFQSKDEKDAKQENDIPNPAVYYAWTKVWSENMVPYRKSKKFKYIILRPRQPISSEVNYKNMLVKMLTFSKFVDTPNTLTVIEDLMEWTDNIISKRPVGVIHVANEGWTTPYRIYKLLKKHILPEWNAEKISKAQLDKITPNRRVDTRLNVNKLKKLGIKMGSVDKRLEEIVIQLGKNLKAEDKRKVNSELQKTIEMTKTRTIPNKLWKTLLR